MGNSGSRETAKQDAGGTQKVKIGDDAKGVAIVHGEGNLTDVKYVEVNLPPAESVNIHQELQALRSIMARLQSADQAKIDNRLEEAIDEAWQDEPDKDGVSRALEGAIKYAKKANDFSEVVEDLIPRISKVCGWLGKYGGGLLGLMGLAA